MGFCWVVGRKTVFGPHAAVGLDQVPQAQIIVMMMMLGA